MKKLLNKILKLCIIMKYVYEYGEMSEFLLGKNS